MPKIVEYEATVPEIKITPNDLGYSATEVAARRIAAFAEQEAQGTREVGQLQNQYDREVGQAVTDFLRFKGLEDQANSVRLQVKGNLYGGGEPGGGRPAAAPRISYPQLREMHGGPAYLSTVARSANARTNQTQTAEDRYWNNINQKNMDQLNKDDYLGGDPLKEMHQIATEADEAYRNPDMKQAPDYIGPGANFDTTSVMQPSSPTDYAPSSTTVDTGSNFTETPPNTSPTPSLWDQITTGQSDTSTNNYQGSF